MRMKNAILCLAQYKMMLFDTSVLYAYEASSQFQVCGNLSFLEVFIHFGTDGDHIIKNHHYSFDY